MWISRQHYEAMQTMRRELHDILEQSIRDKNAFIERLEARIAELEAERKAYYERIQQREDERRKPMEALPDAAPESWEDRMRREIAEQGMAVEELQ